MIILTNCAEFSLGNAVIRPPSREIAFAGRVTMVEPKVMQMLVALARESGRVVPREELILNCWDERIVGEDAVNRVIGKLRRAARDAAGGAFLIETVARVGLRLRIDDPAAAPPPEAAPPALTPLPSPRPHKRRIALLVACGVGVAAIGLGAWSWPRKPPILPPAAVLPAAVTDLETRGLSAMFEDTPERTAEGVAYLRQATAANPRSASTWGSLAMSYVLELGWTPATERPAVAARVRDAAAHALAIDPKESRSAAAMASLEPTFGHWQGTARLLQNWVARAHPDSGPLLYQRVQLLMAVGRNREALALARPLARASPLVPWIQAAMIDLLAANGQLAEADLAASNALSIWARDPLIWFTAFDLAAFHGRPDRALAMAADRTGWPDRTSPEDIELAARTVEAMRSRDGAAADALMRSYRSRSRLGQGHAERAMRAAAALGRADDAFAFAHLLYFTALPTEPRATMLPRIGLPGDAERPTAALFQPPAQILWAKPGFSELLERIGLAGYWRSTAPPDLCRMGAVTFAACQGTGAPKR